MSLVFGDITQIAYVTRDFDKAVEFFLKAGIGPWFVLKKRKSWGVNYLGNQIETEMSLGLANSGALQFEIIEPTGPARSIYNDWLDKHPSDLVVQHISSWPVDFVTHEKQVLGAGYKEIMGGKPAAGMFGYYTHPDHPEFIFEMAEKSDERRYTFETIAKAAQNWDGKDPIRPWPVPPTA